MISNLKIKMTENPNIHEQQPFPSENLRPLGALSLGAEIEKSNNEPAVIAENLKRLERSGEVGQFLKNFYVAALNEEPILEKVVIVPSRADKRLKNAGGRAIPPDVSKSGQAELHIVTSGGWKPYKQIMASRKATATMTAEKLGIEPAQLDEKLFAAFVFVHELGHVVDWSQQFGYNRNNRRNTRLSEMAMLPIPHWLPSEVLKSKREATKYLSRHKDHLATKGIHSYEELAQAQDLAYHSMPTENRPDIFAARVVKKLIEQ